MPSQHVSISQLKALLPGSASAHQARLEACVGWCALNGIQAVPISTTGIPVQFANGGLGLKRNERQEGFPDVVAGMPPVGRLLLVDCKTGNAVLSPAQRTMRFRFEAVGALYIVMRDVSDLERAIPLFNRITRIPVTTDRRSHGKDRAGREGRRIQAQGRRQG